jgi:hypothetical protein
MIDRGDITTAGGPEAVLPPCLRLYGALKTPTMNSHIAHP